MSRVRTAEPSRSFSIYIPNSLYQKLESKAGKRQINTFIKQVLEKELSSSEEQLKQQLIKGYQAQAKNKKLNEESRAMEQAQFEDLENE